MKRLALPLALALALSSCQSLHEIDSTYHDMAALRGGTSIVAYDDRATLLRLQIRSALRPITPTPAPAP